MSRRLILCVIVVNIGYKRLPVDEELAAAGTVADPVETCVDGFGALLFDGFIGKSDGVELSTCMGVASWGWPSLRRSVRMGTSSCPLV